jgi:hypothetical protein
VPPRNQRSSSFAAFTAASGSTDPGKIELEELLLELELEELLLELDELLLLGL